MCRAALHVSNVSRALCYVALLQCRCRKMSFEAEETKERENTREKGRMERDKRGSVGAATSSFQHLPLVIVLLVSHIPTNTDTFTNITMRCTLLLALVVASATLALVAGEAGHQKNDEFVLMREVGVGSRHAAVLLCEPAQGSRGY